MQIKSIFRTGLVICPISVRSARRHWKRAGRTCRDGYDRTLPSPAGVSQDAVGRFDLHSKNRGAHLGGLPGFHSEYNVLEQPNEIMYFHWSEAHCGLVVVKPQKCEISIKKIFKMIKNHKNSELFGADKRNETADLLNAIVPEGETQRYKVRKNSIYQTKSELL